jgi:hypothetical protein
MCFRPYEAEKVFPKVETHLKPIFIAGDPEVC